MPRKFMFTREKVLAAALNLAREQGVIHQIDQLVSAESSVIR